MLTFEWPGHGQATLHASPHHPIPNPATWKCLLCQEWIATGEMVYKIHLIQDGISYVHAHHLIGSEDFVVKLKEKEKMGSEKRVNLNPPNIRKFIENIKEAKNRNEKFYKRIKNSRTVREDFD